jgi:hypothetical protein
MTQWIFRVTWRLGNSPAVPTFRARACSRVLRYARATGRKCEDVAADLIGLLGPVEPEHMAAIVEPIKIGQLLRAIDGYTGQPLTRLALKLVP